MFENIISFGQFSLFRSTKTCILTHYPSKNQSFFRLLRRRNSDFIMWAIRTSIRRVHFFADSPGLSRFSISSPKIVEVEYTDGRKFNLSAEFLRIHSPAADGKIRSIGGEKVISGRRHVGIMSVECVGNYGVRIVFDDLHKTGIYSWDYFYQLGNNKFCLMKNYVKSLRKHGLTRDPPPRKQ